jgi:PleD family two-component response regulator
LEKDLEEVMLSSETKKDSLDPRRLAHRRGRLSDNGRQFRYCWEYYGDGKLLDSCKDCAVYSMRAQRCYEVAKLAAKVGHQKTFCKEQCEDCDYFKLVHEQPTNVLVVTDDAKLVSGLEEASQETKFNIKIADCEYACSAMVNQFRPDFAVVDCSLGTTKSRDITKHLVDDPRIPYLRVVLAGNDGEFPNECEKVVFARIKRPFGVEDISQCIDGIKIEDKDIVEK